MDKNLAEKLVEILSEEYEAELYEEYSGRSMYGTTTTGVTVNCNIVDVLSTVICCAGEFCEDEEGWPEAAFNPGTLRTDSMGREIIIY